MDKSRFYSNSLFSKQKTLGKYSFWIWVLLLRYLEITTATINEALCRVHRALEFWMGVEYLIVHRHFCSMPFQEDPAWWFHHQRRFEGCKSSWTCNTKNLPERSSTSLPKQFNKANKKDSKCSFASMTECDAKLETNVDPLLLYNSRWSSIS